MTKQVSSTIDVEKAERLFAEVETMRKNLESLRKKMIKIFPAKYGSELWWEKETEGALEEVKKGKVSGPYQNAQELITALHQEAKNL